MSEIEFCKLMLSVIYECFKQSKEHKNYYFKTLAETLDN